MSVKIISLSWLESKCACNEGIKAFTSQTQVNSKVLIKKLIKLGKLDWANWLLVRVLDNRIKQVKYAIFAAEQVIHIYKDKYPNDNRPGKAIQAAKLHVKGNIKDLGGAYATGVAAYATDAAYAAADAVDTAADAAYAAAYAAYAAASTADVVAYAASAAYAAAGAAYATGVAADAAGVAADAAGAAILFTGILKYGITLI